MFPPMTLRDDPRSAHWAERFRLEDEKSNAELRNLLGPVLPTTLPDPENEVEREELAKL